MEYKRELLKGNIDSLLLSILGQKSMYGYQLIKEMKQRSAGYFQFKEGTIYPALHRLEKGGLVQGMWESSSSGQMRRYYRVTEKGQRALAEKVMEWQRFSAAMDMVMR